MNVKKVQAFIDKLINPAPVTPSSGTSSTPVTGSATTSPATPTSTAPAAIDIKCTN